uniref:SGNH/GDSL hydrolase family protein n=1 Tax=Rhodopseudomonas palustris (strain BisA53) TaxID=316055 RepID=Q07IR4_RHOP5
MRQVFPGSAGQPFPALTTLIEHYGSGGAAPDLLLLGDSVSERIANEDADRRTLHQMMIDRVTSARSCLAISHTAYQPAIYRDLMEALARLPRSPHVVMLPINPRAFSPQWHGSPLWALDQERAAIRAHLADPDQPIAPIADVEAGDGFFDQFDQTRVRLQLSSLTRNGDLRAISLVPTDNPAEQKVRYRELFAWHYAYAFDESHPKLLALRDAITLIGKMNATAVCYLTPINVEAGLDVHGRRFQDVAAALAERIARALAPALDAGGHRFADLSAALGREFFFKNNLATEHLNARGRDKLAAAATGLLI